MDNEKEVKVIDTEEKLMEFIQDIRSRFDEIEEKRDSSDEKDLCRVAELIIENFEDACSLEEMKDLSKLIISLVNPENPKKVRFTIAEKLDFKYFNQTPIGYKTYKQLVLTLKEDHDPDIQELILNLSNGDVEKHLSGLKSDPNYIEALSKFYAPLTFDSAVLDNFRGFQEQIITMESALSNLQGISGQLISAQSALDTFQGVQEQISALAPALDYYKIIAEKFEALSNLYLPNFNFIDIAKEFEEITPFWKENEYKAFEYNWIDFCPSNIIFKLYEEYKKGNEDKVKEYFTKMFQNNDNIEKLKNKFKKEDLFLSRIDIIGDALDAHLDGKYTLSIPILLSQIDGIIIKKFGYILKGKYKGTCSTCGKSNSPMPNAKNIALELLKEIDDSESSYYLEFIKKDYNEHRIPILHGRKIDYADPHYSTKLILALYRLFELLNEDI